MERRELTNRWLDTGEAGVAGNRGHFVKRYLLDAQQHMCAICGSPDHWMGMRLILVVDHVNGDSANNARDNLRMVCPNCDSQLPTYKSRNRGKGRFYRRERYANNKSY